MGNQCIRLAVKIGDNAKNAMEPQYDSQDKSDADSLPVEQDLEPRNFPS